MRYRILDANISISIVLIWVALAISAFETALDIPLNHLDGAYQTASGLYRLSAGQLPGRDFFPYLGIGPLLLLFPIFKMAGGNIAASVFATHLATSLSLIFIAGKIFYLAQTSFRRSLYALAFGSIYITIASQAMKFDPVLAYDLVGWSLEPGNSLRPIRALLPYLIAFALLLVAERQWAGQRKALAHGLIASIAILWSNDYAYVTAIGVLAWSILHTEDRLRDAALLLAAFAISAPLFYVAATAGNPFAMLHYNFLDVAKDQWWYFAPWEESYRIFTPTDIVRVLNWRWLFPLVATAFVIWRIKARNQLQDRLLLWIGIMLFAGGLIATIGGHVDRYFSPLYQWGIIVLLSLAMSHCANSLQSSPMHRAGVLVKRGAIGVIAIQATGTLLLAHTSLQFEKKLHENGHLNYFYVEELGGYLPDPWRDYVTFARRDKHQTVIEEYWGVFSAIRRTFPPWPVDSVIHALGDQRSAAAQTMRREDALFIISRYGSFRNWQPWNVSANYWFYQPLLESGEVVLRSPTTLVLSHGHIAQLPSQPCAVLANGDRFSLPGAIAGYYEVSLRLNPVGRGRHLLMGDNRIVFAADAAGWLSLDPTKGDFRFPVYLDDPSYPSFPLEVRPIDTGKKVSIVACSARRLTEKPDILPVPLLFSDQFYTDLAFHTDASEWVAGYSTQEAAFYLPNLERNRLTLAEATHVRLPDGDRRTIKEHRVLGNRIVVKVSGTAIGQKQARFPTMLKFERPSHSRSSQS